MGSTKISEEKRDYAGEYEKNLLTQLKHAGKLYGSEAEFQPKYANLQFDIAKNLTPKVMDLYQNEIYPRMSEMDRAATEASRVSDVEAIEKRHKRVLELNVSLEEIPRGDFVRSLHKESQALSH